MGIWIVLEFESSHSSITGDGLRYSLYLDLSSSIPAHYTFVFLANNSITGISLGCRLPFIVIFFIVFKLLGKQHAH